VKNAITAITHAKTREDTTNFPIQVPFEPHEGAFEMKLNATSLGLILPTTPSERKELDRK
jgi:hypothetical protein